MTTEINLLAVLVAAAAAFALGGVWYGPLFGRVWRTAEGKTELTPEKAGHPALVYGASFALMLIAAALLASVLGPAPALKASVGAGLLIGAGWVATSFGVNYLFAGRRLPLFLVDGGYNVVVFVLMGLIIGLFG